MFHDWLCSEYPAWPIDWEEPAHNSDPNSAVTHGAVVSIGTMLARGFCIINQHRYQAAVIWTRRKEQRLGALLEMGSKLRAGRLFIGDECRRPAIEGYALGSRQTNS